MAFPGIEKRYFPRIKLQRPLHYQIRGVPEFNNAIGDDISLGGMSLINNKFIAPQTLVTLKINILSRILSPTAKIAWSSLVPKSDRYRLGIQFLEIDLQEKRYLSEYINIQTQRF
jgi:c-di-GMP-binding flagellar brake protein YcgR